MFSHSIKIIVISFVLGIFLFISSFYDYDFGLILKSIFYFITQSLPSLTFTITFDFITIACLLFVLTIITSHIVRYLLYKRYAKFKSSSSVDKSNLFDLQPEPSETAEPSSEEYLSTLLYSIKIFGYLEKEVFHELATHLVEKRLKRGEILFQDELEDKSFYVVVDGCIQVTLKVNDDKENISSEDKLDDFRFFDDEPILTEIKAGGTVSSLFNILSLLSHSEDSVNEGSSKSRFNHSSSTSSTSASSTSTLFPFLSSSALSFGSSSKKKVNGSFSPSHHQSDGSKTKGKCSNQTSASSLSSFKRLMARATCDTHLIALPEEAFIKVTQKYPKSAAHIIQVILTRLQRVTFITLYKYLDLVKELTHLERSINKHLRDNEWIKKLKQIKINAKKSFNMPSIKEHKDLENLDIAAPPIATKSEENLDRTSLPMSASYENKGNSVFNVKYNFPRYRLSNTWKSPSRTTDSPQFATSFDRLYEPLFSVDELSLKTMVFDSMCALIGADIPFLKKIRTSRQSFHYRFSNLPDHATIGASSISEGSSYASSTIPFSTMSAISLRTESNVNGSVIENTSDISYYDRYVQLLEIYKIDENEELIKQPILSPGVFFLIEGSMESAITFSHESEQNGDDVEQKVKTKKITLFHHTPGQLIGYLTSIIGSSSFINVVTTSPSIVGLLRKDLLDSLTEQCPEILVLLSKRLVSSITPIVRHIDFALNWVSAAPGQVLRRQGDDSDSIFLIIQGRLRSITESFCNVKDQGSISFGNFDIVAEHGPGESVGELEVLLHRKSAVTIHAIRDTEIAVMPKTLFDALALTYPETTLKISRLIASKSLSILPQTTNFSGSGSEMLLHSSLSSSHVKNVAIVPIDYHVPILLFSEKLSDELNQMVNCLVLDNEKITYLLGKHIFSSLGSLKLQTWLAEQEDLYDIVLYVANAPTSPWTSRCIRQADLILFVGIAHFDSPLGDFERLVMSLKTTARKELVLLHMEKFSSNRNTSSWLKLRPWIMSHHHIQMALSINVPTLIERDSKNVISMVKRHIRKYYEQARRKDFLSVYSNSALEKRVDDFGRLARRLCGKSVGLVFGGGGARGIAHLGVIKALEESNIPIDLVGGTSIGAFVGALYARTGSDAGVYTRAKDFAYRMSCKWRFLLDLTYPVTSWFTGHAFNRAMWAVFGNTQIEDLWLNYFCVTTNLTHAQQQIHRNGYLWRYVRASMSLSGFLPPLCDQGDMLLDGGYLNNLPMDIMKSIGAKTIIAVDVGSEDDTSPVDYGDTVNGLYLLFLKLIGKPVKVPTLAEIQSRLAYVSCRKKLLEVKEQLEGTYYLRPDVSNFGTMEFSKFNEIFNVGYIYGKNVVDEWHKKGLFKDVKKQRQQTIRHRRNSL